MQKIKPAKGPLFLSVKSVRQGESISESLCEIPNICRQMQSLGLHLIVETPYGDSEFYSDMLAYGIVDGKDLARRNIAALVRLLDRNVEKVKMSECIIQASTFDETTQTPYEGLTLHWSARRAAKSNSKVVALFPVGMSQRNSA